MSQQCCHREREEFERSVLCNRYSMWNGICDPEIGKFSPWFCESPPRLLGEHRMGYKETDGGSTVSSQGLEGEERSGCQLHLQLAEDGASLVRTQAFCPRFCPATSVERTKLGWRACYKARYPSWPTVGHPHIGNTLSNIEGRQLYLPWHTG